MAGEETQTMPVVGRDGDLCEQCGSPLAADQRYCLNCGRRRGGPRVEYRGRVGAAEAPDGGEPAPAQPAAAAPQPVPAEKGQRDYAPLAAVGGIAVLGLMLLVGVLIGRGDGDSAPAPAPVVVQSGGGGSGGAAAGGAAGEGGGEAALGSSGSGKAQGGGGKGSKGGGKSETAADAGAVTASEDQLHELESETGEDAAKNALKLPGKIATPGAPPPIDKSKPPGGGEGGGLVIK
jgi:hypothetical protein